MNKKIIGVISRRLFSSAVILFLLVSIVFILLRLSPGDVSQKFISPKLQPEARERIIDSFGLNKSLPEQYASFVFNLVKGDLGISFNYKVPVLDVIAEYFPFTFIFSITSLILQLLIGFLLTIISIKKINGRRDKILSGAALFLYSLPAFIAGIFFIYIFSNIIPIFPSSGLTSYDHDSYSFAGKIFDYAKHLILPLLTLSISGIALYYKYLRDNAEAIYQESFVLNMRGHGFTENEILLKHVLPNALNPLISVAGVELGILFGGALITEMIFGLPGMGRLSVNAILTRDYPLVVGCTLIVGLAVVLSNFGADILKSIIDKRFLWKIIN